MQFSLLLACQPLFLCVPLLATHVVGCRPPAVNIITVYYTVFLWLSGGSIELAAQKAVVSIHREHTYWQKIHNLNVL